MPKKPKPGVFPDIDIVNITESCGISVIELQ
jgi:hypothetical protein